MWNELPLLPLSSERERLLKTLASSWSVLKGLRGGVGNLQRCGTGSPGCMTISSAP